MLTQINWIENKLLGYGKITRNECLRNYISRLSARIADLEEKGYEFETSYIEVKTPFGTGRDYQYKVIKYPLGVERKQSLFDAGEVANDLEKIKEQDERTNALSLIECPFCESNDLEVKKLPITTYMGKHTYFVKCCTCSGGGSIKDTAGDAVKAWNRN